MRFKIGDKVRLVRITEDHWEDEWGTVGAVCTVLGVTANDVRVDFRGDPYGWYWNNDDIELIVGDTHTPADLAMALELAEMASHSDYDFRYDDAEVAAWLRAEVITALYESEVR